MRNLFQPSQICAFLLAVLLAGAAPVFGDDRFALTVGEHGDLVFFAPHGEKVGDFTAPTIAQAVSISGGPSFQVSYGRDVNNQLSAILSPDPAHPSELHFSVMNKTVDADKQAVITLTFSRSLNHVSVDPGYIGLVQVNAEKMEHQTLVRKTPAAVVHHPAVLTDTTDMPPAKTAATSSTTTTSAPAVHATPKPRMNADVAPRALPPSGTDATPGNASSNSGAVAQPVSTSNDVQPVTTTLAKKRLFWAEPVTSNGVVPKVASDEMKLVAVHGKVLVKTSDGNSQPGVNGMLVPTGATVETAADSSAAVFMGGVDSARLVPSSDVVVAQTMEGTVRHTTLDLQKGAVFSRVGRRPGETQKYEVRTPEGVAAARGTEYLDALVDGVHVVYVNKGTVDLFIDGKLVGTVTGDKGHIGQDAMGHPKPSKADFARILNDILTLLQPFNVTTIQALFDYESGKATPAELAIIQEALYGSLVYTGDGIGRNQDFTLSFAPSPVGVHDLLPNQGIGAFQTDADEPTQ